MGIAYEEDIRKAREVLLQVLMEEPGILKDEDMRVFVDSLADSAVLLNVRGWAEKDAFWETKWRLAENVKYYRLRYSSLFSQQNYYTCNLPFWQVLFFIL